MDDDDHSYSDPELDELPANTLLEYETAAIHATQHQSPPADESNYGSDEDDEVINLDDTVRPPRFTRDAQDSGYHPVDNGNAHNDYGDPMDVEEPQQEPPPSQAQSQSQVGMEGLLQRLKKVRVPSPLSSPCSSM